MANYKLFFDISMRRILEQRNGGCLKVVTQLKPEEGFRRMSRWKFMVTGPEPRIYDMKRRTVTTVEREAGA